MKPGKKAPNGNLKKPKKKRKGGNLLFNLLLLIAIIGLGYMFYRAEQARRNAETELEQTASQLEELRNSTQDSGAQVAQEVLSKVRNHMEVPNNPEPTVATITNIEQLRQSNDFYQAAENGDHLIITEQRAILYDADRDIILDVVPVRINQNPSPAADNAPATTTSPAATTSPAPAANADQPAGQTNTTADTTSPAPVAQ